jgi:hypothetical protein
MKTDRNIVIVVLLVICSFITMYFILKKDNPYGSVGIILDGTTGKLLNQPSEKDDPPFWNNYPVFIFQAEHQKLDTSLIVYDSQLNPLRLGTLIKEKTVFFRYTLESNNQEAVDNTLAYIDQLNNPNIVTLVSADNSRYFKFKIRNDEKPIGKIYFIEKPGLNLLIEKRELPFLFTISRDLKVTDVYVPRKEIPEVTWKYLNFQLNSSHRVTIAN